MCFFRRVNIRKAGTICIAVMAALSMAACRTDNHLIVVENEEKRVVELFSPMEKSEAYVENTARSAADKTVMLAEEKLAVVPGSAFGAGGEGFVRISYAYSLADLKKALDRIERFINRIRTEKE